MAYKLLVFDLDGTLRSPGEERVTRAVADAVNAVQAAGVKVALATGRCRASFPLRMLRGIRPDFFICANGAQVQDRAGNVIRESRLTSEEMYSLVDWCEDHEYPLAFVFEDGYYAYVEAARMMALHHSVQDGEDQDHHLEQMPYDAFCDMPPQAVEGYQAKYGYQGLRFVPIAGQRWDILSDRQDKTMGIAAVMARLGVTEAEVVAVGDGANDIPMLQMAGLGVAMGNAPEQVRAAARQVCPPVQQDGVARLLQELYPEVFANG